MSAHFPGGRWTPRTNMTNGPRVYRDGAQGVKVWDRQLSGRWFRFILVVDGWWGVGATGTLVVTAAISNGDRYQIHKFTPAA